VAGALVSRLKAFASNLLLDFPWPLAFMLHGWKRLDPWKPWKVRRVRRTIRAAREARLRPRTARQAVFIADTPRMREAKIARALKEIGWEVILLHRKPAPFDPAFYFSRSERYGDAWSALEIASRYSPEAYHVFVALMYETASVFVRQRPGPVVVDSCDLLAGMKSPWYIERFHPGQRALERYCLENADGICSRDLQVQFLRKKFRYRRGGPTIFLPDLTLAAPPEKAARRNDGEIHVVLMGIIGIERIQPYWPDAHYLKLIEAIVEGGVHFHLYANAPLRRGNFEATFAQYRALERRNPRFHFHTTVPLPQLLREMAGYDFGLHTAGSMLNYRPTPYSGHLRASYDAAVTNRQFDYIQAGLPIILHDGRVATWVLSRLGVVHNADPGLMADPMRWLRQRLPTPEQREKLARASDKIRMTSQIPRLETFYRTISAAAQAPPRETSAR
jgi:hypothetical protein